MLLLLLLLLLMLLLLLLLMMTFESATNSSWEYTAPVGLEGEHRMRSLLIDNNNNN